MWDPATYLLAIAILANAVLVPRQNITDNSLAVDDIEIEKQIEFVVKNVTLLTEGPPCVYVSPCVFSSYTTH